ncbi:ribokinase [Candidatus Epulonipiscium fishelsonii]|uniref:Ribokinase n=1 Tax=Candidatus Epulonipiscium fishelsonii TaxID=77094 RepID=A0ACC8XB47_9FIRM|nr:ribokinase [Epulopiscium sp. SCG-B11WGA-EpuloA1]ONI43450.1 ribokinase [Epulopiscium sp. SCG-B05WGA-EpuloA1]
MQIGVVGSINMDMVLSTERIPLKGETLIGTDLNYNAGGKGANQAVSIAKLGGNVKMFGAVGNDANGEKLISSMKQDGVDTSFIRKIDDENTGLAVITVGEHDNTIVVIPGANNLVDRNYIDSVKNELLCCEIIIMQHEIPQDTNEYVVKICKDKDIKLILNPAPAKNVSDTILSGIDYITPNEHEVKILFPDLSIEECLKKYKEQLIVTQGENGVSISMKDDTILNVPSRKSKVLDTTGAGDTFNGAFAYALTQKYPLEKALKFANITAGISTEKHGAQNGMPSKYVVLTEMS